MNEPVRARLSRFIAVILLFTGGLLPARASHVSGVDISFTCISGNTFWVTLNLFRDCSGIPMDPTETIDLESDCGQSFTLTLNQAPNSGYEISQLCPQFMPLSDCNSGGYPGMEFYTYTAQVTLNPPCDGWTASWSTCCRNPTVNSPGSSAADIYAEATINTVTAPCNNSPVFTSQPIPFVCANQPVSYNYGVYDPDGDSLSFSLISAMETATQNLAYGAGYSGTNPIPGITLDPATGEVNFTPTQVGNYIVVIEVTEYDALGNVIGTVMRDMQFTVIACTNVIPDAPASITNLSGNALMTGPFSLEMCVGNNFCIDLVFTDQDVGDSLTLTTNVQQVLPGATFTQTGVNPATATICWQSIPGTSPVSAFTVFAEDDACPVTGLNQQTVSVTFLPRTLTNPDTTLCWLTPVQLNATGGTAFNWTVLSGEPMVLGGNFSCNPCDDPVASPSITTTYMVTSNLVGACLNMDTVTINVVPDFGFSAIVPQDATCHGDSDGTIAVTPWGNAGPPWTYTLAQAGATVSTTTVNGPYTFTGLPFGTYDLTLSQALGCAHDTVVDIGQPPPMSIVANDTTICLTTDAVIQAQAAGGNPGGYTYTWNQGLVGNGPHTVGPMATTPYAVFATDSQGCTSPTDTATVTLHPPLALVLAGPDSICINSSAVLTAAPSGGNGGPYTVSWEQVGAGSLGTGTVKNVTPTTFSTWYRATLTDNCGTPAVVDSLHIQWYAAPAPNFVADKLEDCHPAGITFTNLTDPNDVGPLCVWNFGDGNTTTGCGSVFNSFQNVGCYDITLTVTSPEGCVGDTTFPQYVCARPYPVADFGWSPSYATVFEPVVSFQNSSQFDVAWTWWFDEGCTPDSAFIPDPIVEFPSDDEGTYPVWLRVVNEYGCPDSIQKFVRVESAFFVFVPNVFTPDGDGINDTFGAQGLGIDENNFRLTIYDRWGREVWIGTDPFLWWDGSHGANGGQPVMKGVYAWKLEVKDKYKGFNKEMLGHVTVTR
ncbi:MAG: gliding motility-associated C-terminal domain-containing protein [Flavobacteriales bacterium]|nr:gliding motility-associated C-terminal domain-containing protein [Flavobacteriales bacterium]